MARSLSPLRVLAFVALCLMMLASIVPSSYAVAGDALAGESKSATATRSYADDQVRVLYCTSCGFKQNFLEVKQYLEDKYPQLVDSVYGANYEVDPTKALLARVLGYAQLVAMVLMVAGEHIFRFLGLDDTYLQKALDNRIGCFAVILLMGSVSQGLVSTGAFEVYYNDDLVFSKLQAGQWPTLHELGDLFDARGANAAF